MAAVAAAALAGVVAQPAQAAQVGVSVQVSQPGVYGRIDIGRFPQPVLVSPQPVIVPAPVYAPAPVYSPAPVYVPPPPVYAPAYPVAVAPQPVYLWVPPGHRRHWQKECYRYNACGVPVYFVEDRWYRAHVMPERRVAEPRRDGDYAWRDHDHDHDRYRGDDRRHD